MESLRTRPHTLRLFGVRLAKEVYTMRVIVTLACTESGDRNYTTTKNKKTHPQRIEMKKYCPRLKKYTIHRETR
jgi:large subunit ribosomal protein L33